MAVIGRMMTQQKELRHMIRKPNSTKVLKRKRLVSFEKPMVALFALLMLMSLPRDAQAAVDCSTAQGQLALMLAKVVVGNPVDSDDIPSFTLPVIFASELFKVPQDVASNNTCNTHVSFAVYSSTTQSSLSGLPNLATTNADFTLPQGVRKRNCAKTRSGNTFICNATLSKVGLSQGTRVFYRVAKRIKKDDGIDPTVWSNIYSFVIRF